MRRPHQRSVYSSGIGYMWLATGAKAGVLVGGSLLQASGAITHVPKWVPRRDPFDQFAAASYEDCRNIDQTHQSFNVMFVCSLFHTGLSKGKVDRNSERN